MKAYLWSLKQHGGSSNGLADQLVKISSQKKEFKNLIIMETLRQFTFWIISEILQSGTT